MTINFSPQALEHELFHHLIDGLKEYAIFMITLDGKFGTWNLGVQRILGYEEADFLDKPFATIFSEEDIALNMPQNELEEALASGRAEDERWHKRKDGTLFWASGVLTLIKDESGEVKGFAKIMRNQTDQKKFEETLIEQTNALEIANRELMNFAELVSHDLKAPLQTIFGFANLLKDKTKKQNIDEEVKESVYYIANGAERMMALISELLKEAKTPERAKELKPVNCDQLVEEVIKELSTTVNSNQVQITCHDLPTINSDFTSLKRILQNLIENACKYTRAGVKPQIDISAEERNEKVVFSVKDNGRGIKQKDKLKIFSLFQRGANENSAVQGHGIGLGTARKLVESLGGKIWVESEVGKGSTFHFSLPQSDNTSMAFVNRKASTNIHVGQ